MEEQICVVTRLPLLAPAALKFERARDPEVARVKPDNFLAGVEDAAIARPGASKRKRLDVAHRRHSVSGRH
jgi:hypothetical protein